MYGLVEEIIVEDGHCGHCFDDGDCTGQDTRIVTSTSFEYGCLALSIDSWDGLEESCHWLERTAKLDRCTVGDTTLNAAAVVGFGLE